MPDIKEKPNMGKPKAKGAAMLAPKQTAGLLTEKYRRQLDQRTPGEENEREYATDQVEGEARRIAGGVTDTVERGAEKARREFAKEKVSGQTASGTPPPGDPPAPAATPKERTTTVKERQTAHAPKARTQDARAPKVSNPLAEKPQSVRGRARAVKAGQAPTPSALNNTRRSSVLNTTQRVKARIRTAATVKSRQSIRGVTKPSKRIPKPRPAMPSAPVRQAVRKARQTAQHQMTRRMTTQAAKAAKTAALTIKRLTVAVVKAVAAAVGALAGLVGGGVLLVVLLVVIIIAAVANPPFGLFFAAEKNAPDTVSVAEAVAQVNMAYNAKLEELQAGDYDSIEIHGQAPDWPDVLAVFAAKIAGADVEGMDVVTLDAARVAKLKAVFEDMTAITSRVAEIDYPGDGEGDPGWTEYILHITITPKSAEDMRTAYAFTPYQSSALDELLTDRAALSSLAGSLTITNADVSAILDALPDDLSPERREAVRTALQLVGKVSYFWGGKSAAIGWDSRWGTLQKVWAEGSSTTGTYRTYGLDCTGFVDWVYRNAGVHSDGHWYIGTNLTEMSWEDALPGDIALFPDASHVGIVVGRSADGGILVCHCSYSQNNVVVSDCATTGFTAIGRPDIFD